MPDSPISGLPSATPVVTDELELNDVSDTTASPEGTSAKTTVGDLLAVGDTIDNVLTDSTAARTLAPTDNGKHIRFTSATDITVTVNKQATTAWAGKVEFVFEQAGAGQILPTAEDGAVTINCSASFLKKSAEQGSVLFLKRVATDVWLLTGEREAA
jgi:hypothetical protein